MTVLVYTDDRFGQHDTGPAHPERRERLVAVGAGLVELDHAGALEWVPPVEAADADLERVHPIEYVRSIERLCGAGGGHVDADTVVSGRSATVARLAAGSGLDAVDRLRRGEGGAAFAAIRPPGHHASADRAMGFCVFNNAAVVAASLAAAGERVAVVDIDAHHGNGTQAIFESSADVLYASWHQWPAYPGTGAATEIGVGAGRGATVNVPLPAGATGDRYLETFDQVVGPAVEQHAPDWLIVSAGFDAHRRDPITDLGLSAGDVGVLVDRLVALVPPGRTVVLLEGGYDLEALTRCTSATVSALAGELVTTEPLTNGGPGGGTGPEVLQLRSSRDT